MKFAWLKRKIQTCYLHGGLLGFAVYLLLASAGLVQAADTTIAFMSNRSDWRNGEIYLMNPDGQQIRQLTKHPQYDEEPAWSLDGKKITFVSFRDLHKPKGIIFAEIYMMNPDGTNPINLTQSPERADFSSSWSPDGKQIAFTSDEGFKWDGSGGSRRNIWVMEADGGNPRNLTNHEALDSSPDWSPDGMQIAFVSNRDGDWEFDFWKAPSDIYAMTPDGANLINLTNHLAADGNPAWSPDGMQIAFTSDRGGNREIYVMNADGTNPINLTNHPARDGSPSWGSVRPLRVSSNGRLVTLWGKIKRVNTYGVK